ncbi:MAG: 5-oxoprolinase subunit PxpA [Bacillus sp. (in: Bacteria)]|nr:5-oxoprolinase subunit PxpA [Bacillus sp. (in: firmicutes)]
MYKVDLNSDLGESFGAFTIGQDEKVLKYVTSANIACGFHGGDPVVMGKTVDLAVRNGVGIGAHPSFPDLQGFGRREMKLSLKEIYHLMLYQMGALEAFVNVHGTRLNHVKPHGALYNMASKFKGHAEAIAESVYDFNPNLILFGLAGSELVKAGRKRGLQVAEEVFADRMYQPDGTLLPRSHPNAMIKDPMEAAYRVIRMVKYGELIAIDGSILPVKADTVCVHGDEPEALEFVRVLTDRLQRNNVFIQTIGGQ